MSESYDGQTAWREKLHMDDSAVQRLGRSVIRAGVSLPLVLLYALAPKPDAATSVLALLAFGLTAVGFRAIVKARTWGVLAFGVAGALLVTLAATNLMMGASEMFALRPALADRRPPRASLGACRHAPRRAVVSRSPRAALPFEHRTSPPPLPSRVGPKPHAPRHILADASRREAPRRHG
jgi:hypothetical protein